MYLFWREIYLDHLPNFKIGLFAFLLLSYKISLCILDIISHWMHVFSHVVSCLFTFVIITYEAYTFSMLIKSNFSTFPYYNLLLLLFYAISKRPYVAHNYEYLFLHCLLKVLQFLKCITGVFRIYCELIFMCDVRQVSNFILLHVGLSICSPTIY